MGRTERLPALVYDESRERFGVAWCRMDGGQHTHLESQRGKVLVDYFRHDGRFAGQQVPGRLEILTTYLSETPRPAMELWQELKG